MMTEEVSEKIGQLKDADVSKTMGDCQQLQEMYEVLHRDYYKLLDKLGQQRDIAHRLRVKNTDLRRAISSAIDYLACMDRITPDSPNEQLAMDVLNKTLREMTNDKKI